MKIKKLGSLSTGRASAASEKSTWAVGDFRLSESARAKLRQIDEAKAQIVQKAASVRLG